MPLRVWAAAASRWGPGRTPVWILPGSCRGCRRPWMRAMAQNLIRPSLSSRKERSTRRRRNTTVLGSFGRAVTRASSVLDPLDDPAVQTGSEDVIATGDASVDGEDLSRSQARRPAPPQQRTALPAAGTEPRLCSSKRMVNPRSYKHYCRRSCAVRCLRTVGSKLPQTAMNTSAQTAVSAQGPRTKAIGRGGIAACRRRTGQRRAIAGRHRVAGAGSGQPGPSRQLHGTSWQGSQHWLGACPCYRSEAGRPPDRDAPRSGAARRPDGADCRRHPLGAW